MEQLNQQTEILELGKRIIKELTYDEGDRLSLLEKWMGHYIAELILKIEYEVNDLEKNRLQKECFETILKLWEKRSSVPNENLPLNNIKQAINTLSELRNARTVWERIRNSDKTSWEGAALQIHDTYIEILRICIQTSIVQDALGDEKAWVDEFGPFLSEEEKEIVNKLDSFLEEPVRNFTFIIGSDKSEIASEDIEKNRMTRIFDRLDGMVEDQKVLIEKLRITHNC